jgi:type II secretory pathway component PulF
VALLPATRRSAITVASRLPWLSRIVSYLDVERFTATLAILMRAGVPIQRALEVAGRAVTRPTLARQIPLAARRVSEGKRLAEALAGSALPPMALSLIAAGERSGNLAENLESLATYYRDHLDESLRIFTALIEPILTLIVGLIIGVVVISIIAPIYQLIGQLNVGGS